MKTSKFLSTVLLIVLVSACGSQKISNVAQRTAKIKAKEWSKEGYKTMGSGVAEVMLEQYYLAEMAKDSETGYPKFLTTEVVGVNSKGLDVALEEAIAVATGRIAVQIRSKVEAKSTRDVNNTDGQAYTKYLSTASIRTSAKLSGGQVLYKVYKESKNGYTVSLGYAYSFDKAMEMFRQEMLIAMANESEEYRIKAEAEFKESLKDQ